MKAKELIFLLHIITAIAVANVIFSPQGMQIIFYADFEDGRFNGLNVYVQLKNVTTGQFYWIKVTEIVKLDQTWTNIFDRLQRFVVTISNRTLPDSILIGVAIVFPVNITSDLENTYIVLGVRSYGVDTVTCQYAITKEVDGGLDFIAYTNPASIVFKTNRFVGEIAMPGFYLTPVNETAYVRVSVPAPSELKWYGSLEHFNTIVLNQKRGQNLNALDFLDYVAIVSVMPEKMTINVNVEVVLKDAEYANITVKATPATQIYTVSLSQEYMYLANNFSDIARYVYEGFLPTDLSILKYVYEKQLLYEAETPDTATRPRIAVFPTPYPPIMYCWSNDTHAFVTTLLNATWVFSTGALQELRNDIMTYFGKNVTFVGNNIIVADGNFTPFVLPDTIAGSTLPRGPGIGVYSIQFNVSLVHYEFGRSKNMSGIIPLIFDVSDLYYDPIARYFPQWRVIWIPNATQEQLIAMAKGSLMTITQTVTMYDWVRMRENVLFVGKYVDKLAILANGTGYVEVQTNSSILTYTVANYAVIEISDYVNNIVGNVSYVGFSYNLTADMPMTFYEQHFNVEGGNGFVKRTITIEIKGATVIGGSPYYGSLAIKLVFFIDVNYADGTAQHVLKEAVIDISKDVYIFPFSVMRNDFNILVSLYIPLTLAVANSKREELTLIPIAIAIIGFIPAPPHTITIIV